MVSVQTTIPEVSHIILAKIKRYNSGVFSKHNTSSNAVRGNSKTVNDRPGLRIGTHQSYDMH